uniref:MFS transporter n=1 Tax=Cyberlindnera americana TaxID=36016 RepID=A0A5P8N937_9ASCO|nr:MFS transporter [Cyberlindnera americana]
MGVFTRDLPHSFGEFTSNWLTRSKKELTLSKADRVELETEEEYNARIAKVNEAGKFKKYLPIITTGSGLFSDGYVNNSIGTVSTCLSTLYPEEYAQSNAIKNVTSIAFVGTVVGMLIFGYVSDYHSRKAGMLWGTIILIFMTILTSGVWGKNKDDVHGMLTALTVYRFFIGIGIGSEYPTGSTACSEASALLPPGKRNRWFCWFTNFMIDAGFVVSSFVPMVMLWICTPKHLTPVWRVTLGLGAIPPISLFILRLYYQEGETFQKTRFKKVSIPYTAVIKFYWFRLLIVAIIWFIYDYSAYAFGLFSSYVLANVMDDSNLYSTFGWNVVVNLFYMPGAFLGAIAADYLGPRLTLTLGVTAQSVIGYAMAGSFETLQHKTAGFVVLYGIFMTLGEFGPGDNIGLLASKTSCTPIRGQYYGLAAAIGKVGAFTGTYVFTPLVNKHGIKSAWWLASSLGLFAAFLALFFLPPVDQNAMQAEDEKFLEYLESIGFDISQLGDDTVSYHADNESSGDSLGRNLTKDEKVAVSATGL